MNDATHFLQYLHDEKGISWIMLLQLLNDQENNNWRRSESYGLPPINVKAARDLCCEQRYVPTRMCQEFLLQQIRLDMRSAA